MTLWSGCGLFWSLHQRYWKVDLWRDFFDTLINFKGDHAAGAGSLTALRQRFEAYFEVAPRLRFASMFLPRLGGSVQGSGV